MAPVSASRGSSRCCYLLPPFESLSPSLGPHLAVTTYQLPSPEHLPHPCAPPRLLSTYHVSVALVAVLSLAELRPRVSPGWRNGQCRLSTSPVPPLVTMRSNQRHTQPVLFQGTHTRCSTKWPLDNLFSVVTLK